MFILLLTSFISAHVSVHDIFYLITVSNISQHVLKRPIESPALDPSQGDRRPIDNALINTRVILTVYGYFPEH